MVGTICNFVSKESDEEVDFLDIHSLKEAFQEAISNNARVIDVYKDTK